jgi:hypothetical protein
MNASLQCAYNNEGSFYIPRFCKSLSLNNTSFMEIKIEIYLNSLYAVAQIPWMILSASPSLPVRTSGELNVFYFNLREYYFRATWIGKLVRLGRNYLQRLSEWVIQGEEECLVIWWWQPAAVLTWFGALVNVARGLISWTTVFVPFFSPPTHGFTAPSGPWPPHYRGFMITPSPQTHHAR